ncbi:hypothetical protein Taro_029762 [Colocasia esculenta]|uniref:Uncharacterized protein n=1 Tax=Colocasia esculenta TaxID=4460 RepID=A0A843W192_COLES|nr:hypothetical protein [Colocasia esculenta]
MDRGVRVTDDWVVHEMDGDARVTERSSGPITVRVLSQFGSCHSLGPAPFFLWTCVYHHNFHKFILAEFPLMRNALTEIYSHGHVLISMCPQRTFVRRDFALKKYVCIIINLQFTHIFAPVFLFEWSIRQKVPSAYAEPFLRGIRIQLRIHDYIDMFVVRDSIWAEFPLGNTCI